ncbi:MAG: sigma-70 family RNA polymerase sigma factor [Planctomycetota bacterium]
MSRPTATEAPRIMPRSTWSNVSKSAPVPSPSFARSRRRPEPIEGGTGLVDDARIDADLVRRSLAGEADAFASLVRRYQRRAFFVAYHFVGDMEDARDVAQEAFLRLHRSLVSFDFGRNFYTWFYRIVANLAIDRLRKGRSLRAAPLDELAYSVAAPAEENGPVEGAERTAMVWKVLEGLDAKFRAVLVLRDIHGLSCREIAPILKVTHATVRWRLHRGRCLFKDLWERRTRAWS